MLFYWFGSSFNWLKNFSKIATKLNYFSFCLLSISITIRWYTSGHFPLSNLYESLVFLSWTVQLAVIQLQNKTNNLIFGVLLTPIILLINLFANFLLPETMQSPTALVPSLQSNWLIMHVTIMILSYGALLVGCILGLCYLVLDVIYAKSTTIENTKNYSEIQNLFDDLSYRTLGVGFPLLTLGIFSGAIWANETWGSYWSWDPKETWALITWFVFAIYLHTRLIKGWKGRKSAIISSVGFVIIWVCYLGVNLIGKGLHSYGWWS